MTENSKVLALKYRPQVFEDLIGQDVIAETIKNSIISDKAANAFLFTGIRGVGKTTFARIVAKALNCENGVENLCKKDFCEHCNSIVNSNHIDVLEMDAASKTGVDDVRDLIEFSRYGPTSSKFKIFIIDEVHMLSKQAFNALLKTLEEPPEYLKFIFATTEVNKIPVTVLSRCQRFDLTRINFDQLLKFLKKVTSDENKTINEDVLKLIVKMSEGSVRDSLSLLDRIFLSENNSKGIDLKSAQEIFGYFDKSYILDIIHELLQGNEEKVLELYKNIYNQGIDPKIFINNFLEILYSIKNYKIINDLNSSLDFSDTDIKRIKDLANKVDNKTIILFWEFSVNILSEINLVSNQHLAVEMFLIRLMYLNKSNPMEIKPFSILNDENNNQKNQLMDKDYKKNLDTNDNENKTINQIKASSQEKEKREIDDQKLSNKININSFSDLISMCTSKKEIKLKYELENNVNLISFKNRNIEISFNENLDNNFIKNLTYKLLDWTGERWIITLSKRIVSKTIKEVKKINENNDLEELKNSDKYKKAISLFPDLEIVNVKNLEDENNE